MKNISRFVKKTWHIIKAPIRFIRDVNEFIEMHVIHNIVMGGD